MFILGDEFNQFVQADCDRKEFIQNFLNKIELDTAVIPIDGKNHIYVKFPKSQYSPLFKIKTVIAHYDRVPDSPGANDNSSSVYSMLLWAKRLIVRQGTHNVRMIFTDGEELGAEGVSSQGAFGLAQLFRRLGITSDDVYVFDCMGRGTIPVLTESRLPKSVSPSFIKKFCSLEDRAERVIKAANKGKWFKLPCNYSDNAGFIANGIPAVAFTMLPSDEIDNFLIKKEVPFTWRMLHTMEDNVRNLTPEAFDITARLLDEIADLRSINN